MSEAPDTFTTPRIRWVSANREYLIPLDKVTYFENRPEDGAVRAYFISFGFVDLHDVDWDNLVELISLEV